MMFLAVLGDFTEAALGLFFGFGCALLLGFVCLRFLVGLMTRQQYNVIEDRNPSDDHNPSDDRNLSNDPSDVRSILWLDTAVGRSTPGPNAATGAGFGGGATGGPYILPATAPHNRFAGVEKSDVAPSGRMVELPQLVSGRIAQGGRGDGDAT
jgi:hypothetical protein